VRTEAAFDTEWAREHWARNVRAVAQEVLLLPAVRAIASPRVIGRERLAHIRPPVVVAANHASHLDTALLIDALPRSWRDKLAVGAAADYFFTSTIRGSLAALVMGGFAVDRKRASATSARTAVRLIEEGWSLILFPEGGRSPDGWLGEVKPGAAFTAAKTGRPIVPIWLTGTDHLLPKGGRGPRRGRIEVLIGDPLVPAPAEGPRDLNARLEAVLRRLGRESASDYYTALRGGGGDPSGPPVSRWRRVWERGPHSPRPTSDWR
jgi:1-acyl-sn-glycerol-3-phosphate acyltransferase